MKIQLPVDAQPKAPGQTWQLPRRDWILAVILIGLVAWAFLPAVRNGFVNFDDNEYVVANAHVQQGLTWASFRWAWSSTAASNWHPLTWLSHMLDCELFGLKSWGHHLTSVMLHALNTLLVFLVLRRMTGAVWRSFFVAALFGLHPLRVESVAWVAERKDLLSTLFWLLTLGAYVRYAVECRSAATTSSKPKGNLSYWLALVFFALGLLSKPMLVTLPFVLLLLDYWPLARYRQDGPDARRSWLALVREKVPFFLLAAASSAVTFMAQKHGGAVITMASLPFSVRWENALVSYCRYLGKLFYPVDLAIFYPHPGHWPVGIVALAGLLLVGISAVAIRLRKVLPYLPVGWFWFLGTLVPVIGVIQVGEQAMADRYLLIPSLGLLIGLIWGVEELAKRWRQGPVTAGVAGAGMILLCAVLTRQQVSYWRDSETLFRHATEVTKDNFAAHINLGNALFGQGRLDETISHFREAVRLKPEYLLAHNRLATALHQRGILDEAIKEFEIVLSLNPKDASAHNDIGAMRFAQGRTADAIAHYQQALALQPDAAPTHYNLGLALFAQGHLEEAMAELRETLRLKPDYAPAHYNLGIMLAGAGQADAAIREFKETLRLEPGMAKAHYRLGLVLSKAGEREEAVLHFNEALKLQPGYPEAEQQLRALTNSATP